jgi:hypothetical protein
MTIIFFPGQGSSKNLVRHEYTDNKYKRNNLIDKLSEIDDVHIADIPYVNVYYYNDLQKKMYEPIDNLLLSDLDLFIMTEKIFNQVKNLKKPYTLVASSHGIYYAFCFAYLYPKYVKNIISLDGSWITNKLCKVRLANWKKKGKTIKLIKTQTELNVLVNNIKTLKDNDKYIKILMDHVRMKHTKDCIKYKLENMINRINYVVFRDFNSNIENENYKEFNTNALMEHNELIDNQNYNIYWVIDAGHMCWYNKYYKKMILNVIRNIYL